MKKRLLFAFMAISAAVSGYALEQDEYVYTPQGRFLITGANLNANSAFQTMTGWTVVSASTEKTLADNFNVNANGLAEGFNSVQSLDATATEGMYFKFEPTSASSTYVVSFKMKSSEAHMTTVSNTIAWDGNGKEVGDVLTKCVKVKGNSTGTIAGTDDEVVFNKAEELTEEWQTFNYAIMDDDIVRTYFIELRGLPNTFEFADLQIAPAIQVADLRQRDAMLEKLNVYKNCYAWDGVLLEDQGINEAIANLEAIGDESAQADLVEKLEDAQEILAEFLNANMDDYLAGGTKDYNYLGVGVDKMQKVSTIGVWNCLPSGRAHWSVGDYPDMGHFQNGNTWNNGSPTTPMGVNTQKKLDSGSYVFGIEGLAALRVEYSKTWVNDDGKNPAYGIAYVARVVDGAVTDTVATSIKDLYSASYTPFFVTAMIKEEGNYEFGINIFCKEEYQDLKLGSVSYIRNASIWGKNENVYNQKQLTYEADVREQITTGRNNLTTATDYIANAEYFWGKAELQACVDSVETKIAAYEQLDQDAIIATYQEDYVKSTTEETGYMVREVYQEAVKDIIAANKKFLAVNDTLFSLQVAIDNAEATKAMRLYDAATGKAELETAISDAKDVLAAMKKSEYNEDNAWTIEAEKMTLDEAVEAFKATVPAEAITTIVDIDFEQEAAMDAETGNYVIAGAAGAMEFTHFSTTNPEGEDAPFQQGHWENGEQKWKGYLRVGNGTGVVNFDPTVEGDMGTNILKVACDFYIQGLNNRSIGFYLKDASDENVSGLYRNYYQPTSGYEPFGVDVSKIWAKSGGSYNDASPADVEEPTDNPLQKTHFEVILDYGRQSMYCNISSPNGSTTSNEVALEGVPTQFVLQCDYDNKFATRRCWFDNLKIQRVAAGETTPFVPDGIQEINTNNTKVVAPSKMFKNGRIIINGKYGINGVLVK